MAYLNTPAVSYPLDPYIPNGLPFGKRGEYKGVLWGVHLGEDAIVPPGTDVRAIGRGRVVYAGLHAGSEEKPNWGNIIIVRHRDPVRRLVFYSLLAHLGEVYKRIGDRVELGEPLGFIGEGYTRENGFWEAHLHFAIYTGPWKNQILPGYWKQGDRTTRPEWWQIPSRFIAEYGSLPAHQGAKSIPIRELS